MNGSKIGVVAVVYSTFPEDLFASLKNHDEEIRYYIFFHGTDKELDRRLDGHLKDRNALYLPFGTNRGLARSWNEGMRFSFRDGNRHTLIINDDVSFVPGGFRQFIDFLDSTPHQIATLRGLEVGGSPDAGEIVVQECSCWVPTPSLIEKVGFLDQNLMPAYYEDVDFIRRMRLLGEEWTIDQRVLVMHNRNQTIRTAKHLSKPSFHSEPYHIFKWGGAHEKEVYKHPFNRENISLIITAADVEFPYPFIYKYFENDE